MVLSELERFLFLLGLLLWVFLYLIIQGIDKKVIFFKIIYLNYEKSMKKYDFRDIFEGYLEGYCEMIWSRLYFYWTGKRYWMQL